MTTLKEFRIASGHTQHEVAKKLDVEQGAVSHWELGRAAPAKKYRVKLAKYYNVPLSAINMACEKVAKPDA